MSFTLQSRLVRVLNLWQKNNVFPVEVIQPLLDLAADPNNAELVASGEELSKKFAKVRVFFLKN